MRKPHLGRLLEHFEVGGADLGRVFAKKLATENTWQEPFVQDAIREYKRFIYLMAISPSKVAPSEIIDIVWHLHLTFTKNYWDDLCGQIVKKPLHHNPGNGSDQDQQELQDAYQLTLSLYRKEFDEEPPARFWPQPGEPGGTHEIRTFNPKHYLLVPRKLFHLLAIAGFGLVLVCGTSKLSYSAPFMGLGAIFMVSGLALGPRGLDIGLGGSCAGGGCGGGHGGCNGACSGSCSGGCGGGGGD